MKTIRTAAATTFLLAMFQVPPGHADEVSDVRASSAAFYSALEILDDGTAMSGVYATTPYVTFVGPLTKDIVVGWPALKDYFAKVNKKFKSRKAQVTDSTIHVSGSFAWEVGHEHGENVMSDGTKMPVDWVVTNIFEKQADGQWRMVSHHVQPGAK